MGRFVPLFAGTTTPTGRSYRKHGIRSGTSKVDRRSQRRWAELKGPAQRRAHEEPVLAVSRERRPTCTRRRGGGRSSSAGGARLTSARGRDGAARDSMKERAEVATGRDGASDAATGPPGAAAMTDVEVCTSPFPARARWSLERQGARRGRSFGPLPQPAAAHRPQTATSPQRKHLLRPAERSAAARRMAEASEPFEGAESLRQLQIRLCLAAPMRLAAARLKPYRSQTSPPPPRALRRCPFGATSSMPWANAFRQGCG